MNTSGKRPIWIVGTQLGILLCAVASASEPQSAAPAAQPVSVAASTGQDADRAANEALRQRVKAALHASPYFYDQHVTVSIEDDDVVLGGFVFSDWDLRDALRIAREAAGDRSVIDNLSIKEGGSR